MDLSELLTDVVLDRTKGGILVVAYSLAAVFFDLERPLTFFGASVPIGVIKSTDYSAKIRSCNSAITSAIEQTLSVNSGKVALVYLDADHTIGSIVQQINAALIVCGPSTVFVLPGAAPPERNMSYALPTPGQSSWVGEVWTLPEILEEVGATVKIYPAGPMGVLLASNVRPLNGDRATVIAGRLQSSHPSDNMDLEQASLSEIEHWLDSVNEQKLASSTVRVVIDEACVARSRTTVVSQKVEWRRQPPSFAYDLSGANYDLAAMYNVDRTLHSVQVDEFNEVTLPGRDVMLSKINARTVYWNGKNVDVNAASHWMSHIGEETYSDADVVTCLQNSDTYSWFDAAFLEKTTKIDVPVFFATPDEYPNYGMWLLYSVPSVKLFQEWKHRYPSFMAAITAPWQRKLLTGLGLKDDEILDHRLDRVYSVSSLATMRQTYRSLALASSDADAFDQFADASVSMCSVGPKRIFVSRLAKTRGGGHRGLRNEEELIEALRSLGIVAVEPERYSIAEQASLFRTANLVVGLGGAAMFNTAFCRAGTKVIDIESGMGFVDSHCNLFASRGTDYGIIIGSSDDDPSSSYHKTWTIDVDEVVRIMKRHL